MKATATALRLQVLWKEPEDHQAVAVSCHHDTPDTTSNSGQPRQHGLNIKLSRRAQAHFLDEGRQLLEADKHRLTQLQFGYQRCKLPDAGCIDPARSVTFGTFFVNFPI
jgi:hypothetical protein